MSQELVTAGRLLFADTVARLDDARLSHPTLCEGWDVRVLTAHLLLPFEVSFSRFAVVALRHGGDTDRAVDAVTRRLARRPFPELVEALRRHAHTVVSPRRVGSEAQLVETAVHLRDLTRPQGLAADVPPEHWRAVLDHLTSPAVVPTVMPRQRIDGLSLSATDLGWQHGSGAEVAGPAEALALALTGRSVALPDLEGPGVRLLEQRLGTRATGRRS